MHYIMRTGDASPFLPGETSHSLDRLLHLRSWSISGCSWAWCCTGCTWGCYGRSAICVQSITYRMYRYSGFALELAVWGVPGQPTTPTYACSRRTGRHQRHCWAWSWSACLGELLTTFCSLYRGGVAFLKVGVHYKTRRALTSRKIFECTPYWRGTKSSIWPPSLGYIGYATMEAT